MATTTSTEQQTKTDIRQKIQAFQNSDLVTQALAFFKVLGYTTDLQAHLTPPTAAEFQANFVGTNPSFNVVRARLDEWLFVDLLFQLTGAKINANQQLSLLNPTGFDLGTYQSFLFFTIELSGAEYTRTQLADITREVNKLFEMPVSLLFKHGEALTLSIVTHRPNKQDDTKDVLEKVTLIKDIDLVAPNRAHLEILYDLSLPELHRTHKFTNFDGLQEAWKQTLDSSLLNKRFFQEIADWYFWAAEQVEFPPAAGPTPEVRNATSLIRLLTRLIFVWFLKEKNLIPDELFNRHDVEVLLKDTDPAQTTYYKAILQNLFFATLNQEMNMPGQSPKRAFRRKGQNYNVTSLYRYEDYFHDPAAILERLKDIPFLNGGLFECLDKPEKGSSDAHPVRIDGFSDRPDNPLRVPNRLFFSDNPNGVAADEALSKAYGTTVRRKVRGLLDILAGYKFTITENTPIEEEIALDPELLGKVFENLLAYYNPETQTTARKQTGSFYTPREIVNYMVDESLTAYLTDQLASLAPSTLADTHKARLAVLFAPAETPHDFAPAEVNALIRALDNLKVLDPACGSGAFPMGILHRLVTLLQRLDPHNTEWKQRQLNRVDEDFGDKLPDGTLAGMKREIEEAFERNELDYGRKLFLIENCIYGVDIQPVAVQIAKLRCFISLIVDQRIDPARPNRGVRPLPNLETKFVAANSLLGIERPQRSFADLLIHQKEEELAEVRRRYFSARTPATKKKYRDGDDALRAEIAGLLREAGFKADVAGALAAWDPYDQNTAAAFFDPEWMFNLTTGFDLVIGNPPYGADLSDSEKQVLDKEFLSHKSRTKNSAIYFIYKATQRDRHYFVHCS